MKGSDIHRSLAEEAHTHLVPAAILDGEADAGRNRNVSTDDSMTAEEICLGVENVHGPALSTRAAGLAAEQLGHDGSRAHSARERLTVITVRGDYVVVGANHGHHAGRDCFLSDIEVAESADFSERIGFGAALLEASLEEHRVKQLAPELWTRRSEIVSGSVRSVVFRRALFLSLLRGRTLRFSAHTPAACTCSHAW